MLLIGLRPIALSLFWIWAGEGPTLTPEIRTPQYLGAALTSKTSTRMGSGTAEHENHLH